MKKILILLSKYDEFRPLILEYWATQDEMCLTVMTDKLEETGTREFMAIALCIRHALVRRS